MVHALSNNSFCHEERVVWLKEVDCIAIQSFVHNLADVYTRFFKSKNNVQSYTTKKPPCYMNIIWNCVGIYRKQDIVVSKAFASS